MNAAVIDSQNQDYVVADMSLAEEAVKLIA